MKVTIEKPSLDLIIAIQTVLQIASPEMYSDCSIVLHHLYIQYMDTDGITFFIRHPKYYTIYFTVPYNKCKHIYIKED